MVNEDILKKRSLLFSARIRFSSETQPIRETAIDKIIEQNLLLVDTETGISLREVDEQDIFCFISGEPIISLSDIEKSFERLVQKGRLIEKDTDGIKRYYLSEEVKEELWNIQKLAEIHFNKVIEKLFKNLDDNISLFNTPFLEILCNIFSNLSEMYVLLLQGELDSSDLLNSINIHEIVANIVKRYPQTEFRVLLYAVIKFFKEKDPDFDALKWNIAQNYYVSKALGLDQSGKLLSKEIFGNSIFYLDTNVIINAIEPKARHHKSFKVLSNALQKLNIDLRVCQISLDELSYVVENRIEIIQKVADQIPQATVHKVRGIFYQLYLDKLFSGEEIDFSTLFDSFKDPMESLSENYGIKLIDEHWFVKEEHSTETLNLTELIIEKYKSKRGRKKSKETALHDSLLLRWILSERGNNNSNVFLITLDTSLPGFIPDNLNSESSSIAIILDALLQWISSVSIQHEDEDQIAEIFSEAIKYKLLPQDSFFDLRDFLVFSEMEMSCKELPAEDVEECIKYIKKNAPALDPTDIYDIQKLSYETLKFFKSPGRKYKDNIQKLESELIKSKNENIAEKKNLEKSYKKIAIEKDEEIKKQISLIKSAYHRLGLTIFILLAMLGSVFFIINNYGSGVNLLEKLSNTWWLPSIVFSFWIIISIFIIGKERLKLLDWPFNKLLQGDN
ncbi:MAG: PIN domain-containing protein [Candidatus Hodarchaeota archaeon]